MNTFSALDLQAVQAAKNQDWPTAIQLNQNILEADPNDVHALNRLGVALVQQGETTKAKAAFNQVLDIDKSNVLAKKHLDRIKHHQGITLSSLPADEQFIEEPGKTRTVILHRLAGTDQLTKLAIGQICTLRPKNRYISVEAGKTYVGSLPEDLSYRLTKLLKNGNEYTCYIRSLSPNSCSIFIKETFRSKKNEFVNSFPSAKNQMSTLNDLFLTGDDILPLQMEDIPLQMVKTDEDTEKTIDSYQVDETGDDMPEEVDA